MLNKYIVFFLEEITKRVDEGSPVGIIYLEFHETFHEVSCERLVLKLKVHGRLYRKMTD